MTEQRTVLSVRQAERRYVKGQAALAGADLDLHAGRIAALLGPSGSGKSTLLRAIAGLERLDGGEIRLGGALWSGPKTHLAPEARRVGMVFQDYALFPHLTALANVAFGLKGAGARDRAMAQLEAAELGHKAGAYPHELSGGEQQRVALARALAPEPAIILLDEPFSGLDRRLRHELRERTVDTLRRAGATALIVTHDADEAMAVADELALMEGGSVIQTGTPEEVWMRPVSAVAARLLGDVETVEAKAQAGRADTPFGAVDAPGLDDGTPVHVLVRPQAIGLTLDESGAFTVTRRRSAGTHLVFDISDSTQRHWHAHTPSPSPIGEGDSVSVTLDPAYVTVVEA
ncbi:ABC transporter ATP-binding protein [Maricaulis sp.]|uniref:ABC transporter ATP-binding protein n=1 Tax=Maricaulis sp. TaxID=1486257 RepID=UPI00261856D7|nr:ABC transporter ATP-binding protein [Maricaulis sp.]